MTEAVPPQHPKKSRRYDSPLRTAQAQKTRLRILEAARDVLKKEGFARVTLDAIARHAGFSVQTVLANFGSKAGIFEGLLRHDMESDFGGLVDAVRTESTARQKLLRAADFFTCIHEKRAPAGSGVLFPEPLGGSLELRRLLEERAVYLRALAENIFTDTPLPEGLTLEKAVAILEAYAGPPLYILLVRYYGWTADDFRHWLGKALIDALLTPEGSGNALTNHLPTGNPVQSDLPRLP